MTFELDRLDRIAASVFDGYLVRKDLVRKYARQYPVPTYVVEFLLGRYCASVEEAEIEEGLGIVEKLLKTRTVRTGEEELFKSRARENGSVRLIDPVKARLDARNDRYVAELPSLNLRRILIDDRLVGENDRMLTDGFYAEVTLGYDAAAAQETDGRPFRIDALRPIQMSKADALDVYVEARSAFSTGEWIDFLLRSIGLEPAAFDERAKRVALLRMVPFVERNYNLVELGPRGTGKSHLFQQISPYAHLVSGGKATVARMFVNNANGQRGLVCRYDVVCFDEVAGISFDRKDGMGIMKGYMASGQFSRGKENIRAEGSLVLVGNLDTDVEKQLRTGHLLSPLPPEMRDDTAFMDRLHAYAPGWDYPKLAPGAHLTDRFGLVTDMLSECWSQLRKGNRAAATQGRARFGGALSGRDIEAVNKTVSGLVKLLFPDAGAPVPDDDLEWILRAALEARRRVKEQQKRVFKSEFRNTHFSYVLGTEGAERFVATPETRSDGEIDGDPLPPGQVWGASVEADGRTAGLYRLEASSAPGGGLTILNDPAPPRFVESARIGERSLRAGGRQLIGGRNPRDRAFSIRMTPAGAPMSGDGLAVPVLAALCGAMLGRNTRGGTVVTGHLDSSGGVGPLPGAARLAELAAERNAQTLLMPVSARRQLDDLSDDVWTRLTVEFYRDGPDGVFKALTD